jgi:release factor glutamine methyltransferase
VTVLEVIQRSTEFLAKKGVEPARLQAELLLADALKLQRMQLYLNFERVLSPAEIQPYRESIRRRAQREPLQHIVGSTSFCGLEITVNRNALVPRPETELLAEYGWKFLNGLTAIHPLLGGEGPGEGDLRASPIGQVHREGGSSSAANIAALDFGTGTGCLAIALAAKCPPARVHALDVSAVAIELARQNAVRHGFSERIQFWCGDGFTALPKHSKVHLLISNPPYIPSAEIDSLDREVRDYDPRIALDGGSDGLEFYRVLAAQGAAYLNPDGKAMVEMGDGQSASVREIFEQQNWVVEGIHCDYNECPRILIAHRAHRVPASAGPLE